MNRLYWIDMEMTGLDVEKEVIIEVAAIITDWDFTVVDSFETVVKQPQIYLDNMDAWNKEHHGESGLTRRVPNGMDPSNVEDHLIELVYKNYARDDGRPVLAGNSIMQDRLFINKHFPRFANLLHYRMLDVTAWKIVFQNKFNHQYEKQGAHRALDDIRESIEELKFYLSHVR